MARECDDTAEAQRPRSCKGLSPELGPDSMVPAVACHDPSDLDLALAAYEAVSDQAPADATAVVERQSRPKAMSRPMSDLSGDDRLALGEAKRPTLARRAQPRRNLGIAEKL